MAIKNKDGSLYKVQTPNPLLKNQDIEDDLIVHNFEPEYFYGKDHSHSERHIDSYLDDVVDIKQSVEEFMSEPEVVETKVVEEKPKVAIKGKLIAWCLPAVIKQETDSLYGEVKRSVSYSEKFSFETVVVNRGLVNCDLWSPLFIEKNSIIYLWEQREWWKVSVQAKYDDGWKLTCYPSDRHPSF